MIRNAHRVVSLVLFDLGGVVCDWSPERRLARYEEISGLSRSELNGKLVESGFSADCDRGRYSAAEMRTEISGILGTSLSACEAEALQALSFRIRPDVLALARRVSARVATGLLTNNSPLLRAALPRHLPQLLEVFEPVLFSCELGSEKPDPALYAAVERRVERAGKEILLIDDSVGNVEAARRAGWQALHFESVALLESELASMGLPGG